MKSLHPVLFLGLLISTSFFIVSCGKDKFQTKPQIEIASYSTKELNKPNDNILEIRLNYTDKEGDVGGGVFYALIERLNRLPLLPDEDKADTIRNMVPDAPKTPDAELRFELPYGFLKESTFENDTIQFKFALIDRAGNSSDTITSDKIVILQ